MAVFRDTVAVMGYRDVGEYDRIYILFGKKRGLFEVVAKGVRRMTSRKRGHLRTFNMCAISYAEGKTRDVLIEAESRFSLDTEGMKTEEFEMASFAGMVVSKFIARDVPEPELYDLWGSFVKGQITRHRTILFVVKTLFHLGFVSREQARALSGDDAKALGKLKRQVDRILDTL